MNEIAIFIEGGGSFEREKRVLRAGFDSFFQSLKRLAAERGKGFRIIACGSRDDAFRSFENERKFEPDTLCLLLVDSEEQLTGKVKEHLINRERHWKLAAIDEADLHLMTATMETWIVADADALQSFYGQHFAVNKLPRHQDIEQVSKADMCGDLLAATQNSQAGPYHKMRHAPKLLSRMDSTVVRRRCKCCNRLFLRAEAFLQA